MTKVQHALDAVGVVIDDLQQLPDRELRSKKLDTLTDRLLMAYFDLRTELKY